MACFVANDGKLPSKIEQLDSHKLLPQVIAEHKLTDNKGIVVVPMVHDQKFYHTILIGMGDKALTAEQYRRMVANIVRHAEKHQSESLNIFLQEFGKLLR